MFLFFHRLLTSSILNFEVLPQSWTYDRLMIDNRDNKWLEFYFQLFEKYDILFPSSEIILLLHTEISIFPHV